MKAKGKTPPKSKAKATRKRRPANPAPAPPAPPEPKIVREQKEAARLLGITDRGLRDWMKKPGFPDWSAGYDVDAIRAWADDLRLKGSLESEAEAEYYDEGAIQAQLREIDAARAAGTIDDAEADAAEDALLERLMEGRRR